MLSQDSGRSRVYKFLVILFVLFACSLLTSCIADPRKEAIAYSEKSDADQKALDAQQQRDFLLQKHLYDIARLAWWKEVYQSALATAKAVSIAVINIVGYGFALSVFVALLGFGIGVAIGAYTATTGTGKAVAQRAEARINPPAPNPGGGLKRLGSGVYLLTDQEHGSPSFLSVRNEADLQKIRVALNTREVQPQEVEVLDSKDILDLKDG